jgi:hypothetical protein
MDMDRTPKRTDREATELLMEIELGEQNGMITKKII